MTQLFAVYIESADFCLLFVDVIVAFRSSFIRYQPLFARFTKMYLMTFPGKMTRIPLVIQSKYEQ